jgi:hypothetical protein
LLFQQSAASIARKVFPATGGLVQGNIRARTSALNFGTIVASLSIFYKEWMFGFGLTANGVP